MSPPLAPSAHSHHPPCPVAVVLGSILNGFLLPAGAVPLWDCAFECSRDSGHATAGSAWTTQSGYMLGVILSATGAPRGDPNSRGTAISSIARARERAAAAGAGGHGCARPFLPRGATLSHPAGLGAPIVWQTRSRWSRC